MIDEGARLGVSSRGMGTLKPEKRAQVVQDDFYLATNDIVADPSAPVIVEGIMEGVEWVWDNGLLKAGMLNVKNKHSKSIFKTEVKLREFKNLLSIF